MRTSCEIQQSYQYWFFWSFQIEVDFAFEASEDTDFSWEIQWKVRKLEAWRSGPTRLIANQLFAGSTPAASFLEQ